MVGLGGNGSQMWVTAEFHSHFLVSDADWGWPWTRYMFQGGDDGWGGRLTSPDNRHLLVYMSQQLPNIMSEILRHRSHELDTCREATLPALRMYSTYSRTTQFTPNSSTFYNGINLIDMGWETGEYGLDSKHCQGFVFCPYLPDRLLLSDRWNKSL
jgi:hypothetical protein